MLVTVLSQRLASHDRTVIICHLVITLFLQAGPGTIAEAMIRGLPIILNDYIAGQVSRLTLL